jgi:CDP-glycerol glycerophosphotransferase (TagB/SpsB family)
MGFGEVCRSEDELIDLIEDYMKNDCKMKDKYLRRVDEFYLYTDKNNCKRVHETIKKIPPRF